MVLAVAVCTFGWLFVFDCVYVSILPGVAGSGGLFVWWLFCIVLTG